MTYTTSAIISAVTYGIADNIFRRIKGHGPSANPEQKRIIGEVENGTQPLSNRMRKGNYGEMKMDVLVEESGGKRISLDRCTDIDAKTHHGIDGVFTNPSPPPPFIVGEAKYKSKPFNPKNNAKSQLGLNSNTKTGPQMSKKWIETRLKDAVGRQQAKEIIKKGYKPVTFRIDASGHINLFEMDAAGGVVQEILNL